MLSIPDKSLGQGHEGVAAAAPHAFQVGEW